MPTFLTERLLLPRASPEQKLLARQLHNELYERVSGLAKPGELQEEELEHAEQEQ